MAYNWDFNKDYIGRYYQYIEKENGYCVMNLYTGNGLFIGLWETKKQYQVGQLAIDQEHFKTCIKDSLYHRKDKFILNTGLGKDDFKKVQTIAKCLTGVCTVVLRTADNPIQKHYIKTEGENQDDSI